MNHIKEMADLEQRIEDAWTLVQEALAEDRRERSKFDVDSFAAFFPEHDPSTVREAWRDYDQLRNARIGFK